jgi:aryl-alcohol dehydrogenase-like predicted oxidoreductase
MAKSYANSHPEQIREVDGSLKVWSHLYRLHVAYQHRVDPQVPIEEVVAVWLSCKEGRCVLGLSKWRGKRFCARDIQYQLFKVSIHFGERNLESRILPLLRRLGLALFPFTVGPRL